MESLAQADESYLLWRKSYEENERAFREFADCQPEDIRNMLWAYAAGGRLMNQRLVNLACQNMVFPGE